MDWTRGRIVGQGSSATVSIGTAHRSGKVFAVKSAELSKSEFLQKEQIILSKVRCDQIIAYEGCNVTIENGKLLYNLCMEFAPGGTLTDAIRRQGGHLDETRIRSYTCQVLKGLEYLHSNGIVHCDIKGSNVLITSGGVKIGDLGCAKIVGDVSSYDSPSTPPIAGTPLFMAPEVARGEQQGYPADVWALGCTVIEMATGQAPWTTHVSDPISALYRIGLSGNVPEIPSFMSKEAKDFLSKCLKRDPLERWSVSELIDHAFLKELDFDPKGNYGSNLDTPTSVLDQIFWESGENMDTTILNPTVIHFSTSPMERIRRLSESSTMSSLNITNWAWACEEEWVTVRSQEAQDYEMLLNVNEPSSSERFGSWASQDYYLLNQIDPLGTCEIRSIICNHSHRNITSSLLSSTYMVDDGFCGNHDFKIKDNLSFLFLLLFHCQCFFFFFFSR